MNELELNSLKRINITNSGAETNGNSGSISISDNGQLIPFESAATNLFANDINNATDIFIYDISDETAPNVELVSVAIEDESANGSSSSAVISGDGQHVSFTSFASNLIADDDNNLQDIFVRNLGSNTTEVISVSSNGTAADGISLFSAISGDGDYVAFESLASNLVADDNNGLPDIFLRDRTNETTKLVTSSIDSNGADGSSVLGSISDNAQYLSFESTATNLVADDNNGVSDIFLYDIENETTELVSAGSNGNSTGGLVSGNAGYVIYQSDADNLVADDNNGVSDIFLYDIENGTTELVSVGLDGAAANGNSRNASISDDGRYIAFLSDADNLVADDENSRADIFVRDLQQDTTIIIDADSFPVLSGDAQSLVFNSSLSDLVANDTNDTGDVFLAELDLPEPEEPEEPEEHTFSTDSVHRFYNPQEGYHLYSLDDAEIQELSQQDATGRRTFNDESEQFDVLTDNLDALTGEAIEDMGIVPVYEFFNSETNAYLYTTEQEEISFVETLDNYSDRGVAYYAFESEPTEIEDIEAIPVFRMLNTDTGAHFYTSNQNELDFVRDNLDNFSLENGGEAVFYALDL